MENLRLFPERYILLVLFLANITVHPEQPPKSAGITLYAEVINYPYGPIQLTKSRCAIDVIPSIKFKNWPDGGRKDKPKWIPEKIWNDALEYYHVIPKCHDSGQLLPSYTVCAYQLYMKICKL